MIRDLWQEPSQFRDSLIVIAAIATWYNGDIDLMIAAILHPYDLLNIIEIVSDSMSITKYNILLQIVRTHMNKGRLMTLNCITSNQTNRTLPFTK